MRGAIALLLLLGVAAPLGAQVRPQPGEGDPRIQVVDYKPDQVVQLEIAVGYQLTLEVASDDPIVNVALGDPSAFQASASKSGDRVYIQAVQAGSTSNMTLVSANRRYVFELIARPAGTPPTAFSVRFRYGAPERRDEGAAQPVGRYRLSGARELQPSQISDDGVRTLIVWPPETALPAVFALDDRGRETLVNGNMRDDVYVIDQINRRLVFRVDNHTARAERFVPPPEKPH